MFSLNQRASVLTVFGALFLGSSAYSQSSINTFPLWNGSNEISGWGGGATPTYGQTFTADATHATLTSMRFTIFNEGTNQGFRAYVYEWTGTDTTGSALFTSSSFIVPLFSGFLDRTVETGEIVLTPGTQYVAFFSTIGEAGSTSALWGYLGSSYTDGENGYAGGNFVFNNSDSFSGSWENPTFYGGDVTHDLAFELTFAAVPEPTTWALLSVGLLGGLGGTWQYRRRLKRQADRIL